ncbi:putative phage abortive infection protein [Proteus mirabilis]|uniref:putative phage abortive infection protein n=1 Tax=Proteus mirabilis TaxID=584 RepID=UPI0021823EF9|nr:putative phage abortive infection protein [Proteus mirabilis]ELB1712167.1 hypothetical protein [Proteus mirabilis]MCT0098826.1 putative phage abortive infection protein [Proteus mirabilis]
MKLTGYAKIFLTASVILIASILIVLGSDITLKEMWSNYFSQPDPWVGIFTSIGAIFTVCVFIATVYATRKAGESAKIAGEALELSRESGRKDDFIKQFTLLIEQHNKSHEIMMKVLDTYQIDENKDINWNMTIKEASDKLYLNHQFSPYMRMLFRVLKHCDENFYIQGDTNEIIKEKKKYTSIVRSMIRNDVLYFVAINSMNKLDVFNEFRNKLKKFDFFEHLIVDNIGKLINFSLKTSKIKEQTQCLVNYELINLVNEMIDFVPLYIKNDFNELDFKYVFNYKIAYEYTMEKYNEFKLNIESEFEIERFLDDLFVDFKRETPYCNRVYFLYSENYRYIGIGYSSIIDKKIDEFNLDFHSLSSLILNKKMEKEDFLKYFKEKYHINEFVFSSKELPEGYIYGGGEVYSCDEIYDMCSCHIQNTHKSKMLTKKEKILNDINRTLIKKLNQTHFIKESGERFILNEENKIVFENKNS